MVYISSYNNSPVNVTIYSKTIEFRSFTLEKSETSLKDLEVHSITPYHFLVQKDYYNNISTIENSLPNCKNLHHNLIIELHEYFKDIIPKEKLILYLFYLSDRSLKFPLFDPDIITINHFLRFDLDLIKKYKKFDNDCLTHILASQYCNLDICEYLEKNFKISDIPTKKNEANNFMDYYIKHKYIFGINKLTTKFKIDSDKIIKKSISSKSFGTLVCLFSSLSKVQREKYYNQLIKLMPKLIASSSITIGFIKLLDELKPIAWNEYNSKPNDGFSEYQINQTSILGSVSYHTPTEVIEYLAAKLNPRLICATHYSHSRHYTIYTLYIHFWDRKDTQSLLVLQKLIEIYHNALIKVNESEHNE